MVPSWKRALSWAITTSIRAFESTKDRWLPDVPRPSEDPWYRSDEALDGVKHGTLLAHREIEFRGGMAFRGSARAWQLRYCSTDTAGRPISAVATLMVPVEPWTGKGPRPLLSYQAAVDSLGERADPSYCLRRGAQREFYLMARGLRRGWAVVAADLTGPRRACFAGIIAARIALDGIRAALQFEAAELPADTPIGLWGYSGGGQASAFAAEEQPEYAPELRLAAVAAGGVPTDNRSIYRIDGGFLAGFALGAWVGISREYPELDLLSIANDEGRKVFEAVGDMTLEELIGYFPFRRVRELTTLADPFTTDGALAVNEKLSLGRRLPSAPVFLYHTIYDQLVPLSVAEELTATYRAGGVDVILHRSRLGEHVLYHRLSAPAVLRYLAPRLTAAS